VAAGMDEEKRRQAREFGDNLGLAFQIRDDILDVEGSEDVFGKPIGSDREEGKVTFVDVKGLAVCQQAVEDYEVKNGAAAIAMDVPRQMMATYISSTHEPNSIPNCSQMTEKMKSVW